MRHGAWKCNAVEPRQGGALSLTPITQETTEKVHMYITNHDINPGYVGAMHCCKAPLWGRRLDLGYLNLTPRFAHRPPLLLWLVVVKKKP